MILVLLCRVLCVSMLAFIGSLSAAEISASLNKLSLQQGIPFVVTVELRNDLNSKNNWPEPDLDSFSPAFTLVASHRTSFANFTDDGVITGIRWQFTLKSIESGKVEIPSIRLGSMSSEAIAIEVAVNEVLAEVANKVELTPEVQQKPDGELLPSPDEFTVTQVEKLLSSDLWLWLLIFLVGWLSLAFWRQAQLWGYRIVTWLGQLIHNWRCQIRLWHACRGNDPHRAKEALLAWGRNHRQGASPGSLGELAEQLQHSPLSAGIMTLDRHLYAKPESSSWAGGALWQAFKCYRNLPVQQADDKQALLPQLYSRR